MKRDVMIFEVDFGKTLGKMQKMGAKAFCISLENKIKDTMNMLSESEGERVNIKTTYRIEERE